MLICYREPITKIIHFILSFKLPIAQSWLIQPAPQEHVPSVCRQVLLLGEQTREQF